MRRKKIIRRKKGSGLNGLSVKDYKTIVVFSSLGIITLGGLAFLATKLYKKAAKNRADNKSLSEGDPATYARELKMAFENDNYMGWGTDTVKVYEVFDKIPSHIFYGKVLKYYAQQNPGRNLNADLYDELSTAEMDKLKEDLRGRNIKL